MRLEIRHTAVDVDERKLVRGLFAAERVLSERGITQPDCLAALLAAHPRKARPSPALRAFLDAETAALAAVFDNAQLARTAHAGLVLVISPGEETPAAPKKQQ